jgi:hypothetical protein
MMATDTRDYIGYPWFAQTTVSGEDAWVDDYTRSRSGGPSWDGSDGTASGIVWNQHGGTNQPTDLWYGRDKTGRELDKGKV